MSFIDKYLDEKEKSGLNDRSLCLLKRIEENMISEGFIKNNIFEKSEEIPHNSYFDYIVDRRLDGLMEDPTTEQVWEEMKKIINRLSGDIVFAAEEYRKKENEVRHLKNDYNELLKEQE